jgi:hypothetical protein
MPRTANIRSEIQRLIHSAPFRKFVLNMENGDRVLIEHPENIAFDPESKTQSGEFYVLTRNVRLFSTFDAISSVVLADRNGMAA